MGERRYVKEWEHKAPLFLFSVAMRKTGKGEGWTWINSERVGDDFLVGVSQHRPRKSGPRKGTRMFFGEIVKCVVTSQEIEAEQRRYEAETGNCHRCGGVGIRAVGHSVEHGTLVEDCGTCNATGKAKEGSRV